jgi:hypothetical protein
MILCWRLWTVRQRTVRAAVRRGHYQRVSDALTDTLTRWRTFTHRAQLLRELRHLARHHYGTRLGKRVIDRWLQLASQRSQVCLAGRCPCARQPAALCKRRGVEPRCSHCVCDWVVGLATRFEQLKALSARRQSRILQTALLKWQLHAVKRVSVRAMIKRSRATAVAHLFARWQAVFDVATDRNAKMVAHITLLRATGTKRRGGACTASRAYFVHTSNGHLTTDPCCAM